MAREGEKNNDPSSLKPKTGSHKREFQFAIESQQEIGESLGGLRVRRRVEEVIGFGVDSDIDCDHGEEMRVKGKEKENDKMNEVPSKLKDLLQTGLLEGLDVWYVRGTKGGKQPNKRTRGTIKGTGILCFCDECIFLQIKSIISPNQFELHAGSANKRPADHIYLENLKSLRDVLNACKLATLDSVTNVILNVIGYSTAESQPGLPPTFKFSEPIYEASEELVAMDRSVRFDLNASPHTTPEPVANVNESIDRSNEGVIVQTTCTNASKGNSSLTKGQGKVTKKDLRLHKLVFHDHVLPDGTELGYYLQGKKLLSGYKKGTGIFCDCCDTVVSPSQFESHAGCASRRKPYEQIYTLNGISLHEISVKISAEYGISAEEKDDLCSVCRDVGNNLISCHRCPRVFHIQCVALEDMPTDKWYCKLCDVNSQMERFAERNPNAIAAGRVPGVDPMEQITNRCIRFFKKQDPQYTACALCRIHDFCKSGFGPRTVIICDQCEKEYHVGCLKEHNMQDLKELPEGDWFCSYDCVTVNYALKELLIKGDQAVPYDLLPIVLNKLTDKEFYGDYPDISWRVLHGRKMEIYEILPFLGKAVSVFHEKFDPILYGRNNQDIIPHMVYGRNVKDLELGGMYCVVLSVNSTIVSTAVLRLYCKEVAEIPLVATSKGCEGKGFFQCLYLCIEKFLKGLGVKNLFLPAAEDTRSMWRSKYGFEDMPEELNELRMLYPLMQFEGTSMLHKVVTQPPASAMRLLALCS